jgi:hypothetical protein
MSKMTETKFVVATFNVESQTDIASGILRGLITLLLSQKPRRQILIGTAAATEALLVFFHVESKE